jgi:hypothetical protein
MLMSRLTDYLFMRTPHPRLDGNAPQPATPGAVSGTRIAISILGLLVGIILSFFVTGLQLDKASKQIDSQQAVAAQTKTTTTPEKSPGAPEPQIKTPFTLERFWTVLILSAVICGLTYQSLYFSLRLYQQEPGILILFVSFQYGFFWQAALQGASVLLQKNG